MKQKPQYCHSTVGDEFTGLFDSREEALEEGINEDDRRNEVIYTGRVIPMIGFLKNRTWIGEDVLTDLCDEVSEDMMVEEPVFRYTKEQADELTKIIIEWVVANVKNQRYLVDDMQSHEIPKEKP